MTDPRIDYVRRKTRRRLLFSGVHLVMYFSFALNWTAIGEALGSPAGEGPITGSLVMFVILVLLFLGWESVFLLLDRRERPS